MVNSLPDQEKLIVQHPRLDNMAEEGTWENIQRHGLLKLFNVSEPMRSSVVDRPGPTGQHLATATIGNRELSINTPLGF